MNIDPMKMTVDSYLFTRASRSLLAEMATESSYWDSSRKFVEDNKDRLVGDLSYKQRDWLIRIKDDLIAEAENVNQYKQQ